MTYRTIHIISILTALAAWCTAAMAQSHTDGYRLLIDDDTDRDIRLSPLLDVQENAPFAEVDYRKYPFLKLAANKISLNGADWTDLRQRLAAIDDTVVSILHIGDSHLQADVATSRTRHLLQKFYGSSGRGLICPFRLAGTNQPVDYKITSSSSFVSSSLMRKPWHSTMGFTGVSLTPTSRHFDFTISTSAVDHTEQDFDEIAIYGTGDMPRLLQARSGPHSIRFESRLQADTLHISLAEGVTEVHLSLESQGKCSIFGFRLENSMTGLEYHVIGNNGACYDSYNAIDNFADAVQALTPNLIIISLGTNEAFGKVSDETFRHSIDKMVRRLRASVPDAKILLTTPAECMRSVRVKRRRSYTPNTNIQRLRNVILRYGRDNHVPVYDWYEVAGGNGCSHPWVSYGLLSNDRIHNSTAGYELQGNLFYDALIKTLDHSEK